MIDGHNRYEICQRRGISFKIAQLEFADEDAVCVWIIRNQFGRRNLAPFTRVELALKLEPLLREKAKENLKTSTGGTSPQPLHKCAKVATSEPSEPTFKCPSCRQTYQGSGHICNKIDTREELAKTAGVSPGCQQQTEPGLGDQFINPDGANRPRGIPPGNSIGYPLRQ